MPFAAPCQGLLPSNSTRRRIGFWFVGLWMDAASGFTSPGNHAPHAVACIPLFASSRGGWACPVDANMNIFYSFVNEQFLFNSKKNKNRAMEEENQEWKQC